MHKPQIDNVSAGYVIAYDAKGGDVLWVHEKIVEVIRGREERPIRISEAEREQVRVEAGQVFRGRAVEVLIAPQGFALRENVRISVDPDTKVLREIPDDPQGLAERFAEFDE
jgi:hypothetical protein